MMALTIIAHPSFVDHEGPHGMQPGEWRHEAQNMNGLVPVNCLGATNNYGESAKWVRDELKDYFNNEGAIDWQWDTIHRTR